MTFFCWDNKGKLSADCHTGNKASKNTQFEFKPKSEKYRKLKLIL